MNGLLSNEEAECGLNPNSEDLDAEEDDGPVISIINSSISATIIRSLRTRTCSSLYNLPLHPAKESTHLKPIMIGPGKNIRVGRNTDDRFTYSFSSI
jgi:hypothetical protein